jgi:hypothetical protein
LFFAQLWPDDLGSGLMWCCISLISYIGVLGPLGRHGRSSELRAVELGLAVGDGVVQVEEALGVRVAHQWCRRLVPHWLRTASVYGDTGHLYGVRSKLAAKLALHRVCVCELRAGSHQLPAPPTRCSAGRRRCLHALPRVPEWRAAEGQGAGHNHKGGVATATGIKRTGAYGL